MKHILLTGGSGFFGQNLRTLLQNYTIFAPTHRQLDVLNLEVLQRYIKKHRIDDIIHCATAVGTGYFEPTVMMFRSIMQVAPMVEKVIYYGSGAEYGKNRNLVRVSEQEFGRHVPEDANGLSKYINSLLARMIPNVYILRVFGVYGPHENYRHKFISNAIVKHILRMPIVVKQNAIFDYLWIDDLVVITERLLESQTTQRVFNCTPDESITLVEIAHCINEVSGKMVPISVMTAGVNYQYTGDNRVLKKEFPDTRFHSYTEGIATLYTYYARHKKQLDETAIKEDSYLQTAQIKQP